MKYYQFLVNEETLFMVGIPKDGYDFDIWILGMIFFKRNIYGNETKRFFYLPTYMACKKEIIGRLSEIDITKEGFGYLYIDEIIKDIVLDPKIDYLLLKKL